MGPRLVTGPWQAAEMPGVRRAQVAMERSLGLQPAPFMEAKDEAGALIARVALLDPC